MRTSKRARGSNAGERDLLGPGLIHELRQPLMALDAALRLVARERGDSVTTLDVWSMATGQLSRIQEILETFQQLMAGDGEQGPFSVEPVVRRAVAAQSARLHGLGDRFQLLVERDVPRAHGSAQALLHAVVNLLSNALDAVDEAGGGRVQVRVLRAADSARAQVRVADEGIGIFAADREQVFTEGYTTKRRGKGSGLGLDVSRRMLRGAGGELRLATEAEPARCAWAQTELVVDLAVSATEPAAVVAPPVPSSHVRRRIAWIAAAAAALVALGGGWAAVRGRRPAAAPELPAVAAAERPETVVLESAKGTIERLGPAGWEPLAPGHHLVADDTIRTGTRASATLTIGDRSRVTVSHATQLTVREIAVATQRLRLSRGRISVDHQPGGARVLVVESDDGGSVARARRARFSVLASDTSLAVATDAGSVRLQSAGKDVEVGAGQQAISFRGEPPDPATPIPAAVLLKIARTALGEGVCTVDGVAERGAEVRVEGRLVEVGRDGRFSVRLAPRRGMRATVVTRDAAGHMAERSVHCRPVRAEHDLSDFAVRWGDDVTSHRAR